MNQCRSRPMFALRPFARPCRAPALQPVPARGKDRVPFRPTTVATTLYPRAAVHTHAIPAPPPYTEALAPYASPYRLADRMPPICFASEP